MKKDLLSVDDHAVQHEPAGVGDGLRADALPDENIGESVQALPRDIQSQRKQRHSIGFLFETDADAFNVDDGPTDAAGDDEKISRSAGA